MFNGMGATLLEPPPCSRRTTVLRLDASSRNAGRFERSVFRSLASLVAHGWHNGWSDSFPQLLHVFKFRSIR
ncbi:hypothetical protein DDE84_01220 [Bifidobacterium tibiigranuli]|uniref:Uncharacterized protein n=1 Tax=Bifidobacterium tibiigranuli TaxID=2172043 RepID=A0A5N6SAK3_9BIFI|nr:hypothetical protein DDE84_01220 [Bifidobacterium tibiigranuli]KAE8130413.1 hypothetical protein DDF78_00435 [Bifidobacterium tibiigranuli]